MKNWVSKQKSKSERLRVQTNVERLPTLVGNNPWFQFQLIRTKLETRLISKARTWVRTILGTGFLTFFGCETGPKIRTWDLFFEEKRDLEPGVNSLVQLWISKNWTKTNHDFQNLNQIFFVSKYQNLCMEPEVEPFELVRTGPKPTMIFRTWTRFSFFLKYRNFAWNWNWNQDRSNFV